MVFDSCKFILLQESQEINSEVGNIFKEFPNEEEWLSYVKSLKIKGSQRGFKIVQVCDSCNQLFVSNLENFIRTRSSIYFNDFFIHSPKEKPECNRIKQDKINKYRKEIGKTAHGGCTLPQSQIDAWVTTMRERGHFKATGEKRRGRSFEEQYGDEKAKELREIIRQKRLVQKNDPRLGKIHSEESLQKMSEARQRFYERDEKKYIDPYTGEETTYRLFHANVLKKKYLSLTPEQRSEKRKKSTLFWDRYYNNGQCLKGYVENWSNGKKEYFLSSYEAIYIVDFLNKEKVFYETNKKISIPYIHPTDQEIHYYIPDFTIFEDSSLSIPTALVEVKPNRFTENISNHQGLYHQITKAKIESLKNYCQTHQLSYIIIGEKELGFRNSREIQIYYENLIKDSENRIFTYSNPKKGLLL